jgi:hypothetical protein
MGPPPHEPPTCRCDECDLVMDFDDMPDSYFAFLSNQRKIVEPDKINGAMRDFGRGSDADNAKGKVRSRASQPNLSAGSKPGSKPSVPSLPSIQRTTTSPAAPQYQAGPSSGGRRLPASPSRPPIGPGMIPPGTRPSGQTGAPGMYPSGNNPMPGNGYGYAPLPGSSPQVAAPSRGNALVFVLIAILLAAIGVLAYLVLTK